MKKFVHPKEVQKQIIAFLKKNGSENVRKRMSEKMEMLSVLLTSKKT